jgi:hypothetical protein
VTKQDPTRPVGYKKVDNPGNVGARATLSWKVYKNGRLIKSGKLHDDYYQPVTRVIIVGTKPKKPPPGALSAAATSAAAGLEPEAPELGSPTEAAHGTAAKPRGKPAKPTTVPPATTQESPARIPT